MRIPKRRAPHEARQNGSKFARSGSFVDKLPFESGHGAPVEVFHGLTSLRLAGGVVWAIL